MTDKVTVERRGHILLIGLNNPEKYNAYEPEMHDAIARAYYELDQDPELRCGVLHAHGKHTTAGLNLVNWTGTFGSGAWPELANNELDPLGLNPAKRVSKPVVSAVHGICYTIGIELMLATDIRVAAEDTRFGQIEPRRAIYAVGGATVRFVQNMGWGNAMRWLLTGEDFTAQEAYRTGLVQEVVPAGQELDKAIEIAETIARQGPLGVQASLRSSRLALAEGEQAAFDRLMPDLVPIMQSEDVKEGVQSFVERREAVYKGK